MTDNITLPARVTHVKVGEKDVYLVGTAHLSKESVEDVRSTIEQTQPKAICVELCKARHQAMTQADNWSKMNIFKVIRQKKAVFLLAQLIMTSFYRRLGEKLGVQPGAEMLEGITMAEKTGAELVLADRDIEITLKRVWGYLGFWNKFKLMMQLMLGIFTREEIDTDMIENLKKKDQLEAVMEEFAGKFPEIKKSTSAIPTWPRRFVPRRAKRSWPSSGPGMCQALSSRSSRTTASTSSRSCLPNPAGR